jgi:hypothetical protein
MQRKDRTAPFLGGTVGQFQNRANGACWVSDHGPAKAGNLSRSQPCLGRQDNDLITQWVSAGFGEQQEVFEIVTG